MRRVFPKIFYQIQLVISSAQHLLHPLHHKRHLHPLHLSYTMYITYKSYILHHKHHLHHCQTIYRCSLFTYLLQNSSDVIYTVVLTQELIWDEAENRIQKKLGIEFKKGINSNLIPTCLVFIDLKKGLILNSNLIPTCLLFI